MFSRAIIAASFSRFCRKIFLRFVVGKPQAAAGILHLRRWRMRGAGGDRRIAWGRGGRISGEWGSILLRWLHVTAAIAWIGGSFFFMHLDASLRKRADMTPGVSGVSWQVHGGGFYEMSKYTLAPPSLPDDLIWHKWQSYWTWISGFCLLCWVYYGQSSFFLIDPAVLPLHAVAGGADRHRLAGARLGRLRPHLQVAARQERRAAGARRLRLCRADELCLHAAVLGRAAR